MGLRRDHSAWREGRPSPVEPLLAKAIFCQPEAGGFLRQGQRREHGPGEGAGDGRSWAYAEQATAPSHVPSEGATREDDGAWTGG